MQIYNAGDMLKKGSQILREKEKIELESLSSEIKVYSPKDDDEINDKTNQTEESNNGLAEKIVRKDTNGIMESDIIVIEPTNDACGTMVELGQLKGMKDAYLMILEWLATCPEVSDKLLGEFVQQNHDKFIKTVLPHYEDIRRTDIPESGDRRSWGVNQYVYGVCLDLTNGVGFYDWEDILGEVYKICR